MSIIGEYHSQVGQAVAADCLHALGFDPHAAATDPSYPTATVQPEVATASAHRLLTALITHIHAEMDDADTSATWSANTALPDSAWEAGTGVAAAI